MQGSKVAASATIAVEAVGILSRPADLIPWAILGLAGGALAVRFGTVAPRPSRSFVLWSIARSVFVGVLAGPALVDMHVAEGIAMLLAGLSAYLAEHLLTGVAVVASRFATRPLATWREVRGLSTPEDRSS